MAVSICTDPDPTLDKIASVMKALCSLMIGLGVLVIAPTTRAQTTPSLYTDAQAQSGAALYTQHCAMCHGTAIAGQTFAKPGTNAAIGGIFGVMVTNMPLNQPGSLTHEQYVDIMAYALQKNGYPAGHQALSYKQALSSTAPFVNKP